MNNSVEEIKQDIINVITKSSVDWGNWHIGLTIYPNQEKRDLGKPSGWQSWKTNSPAEAVEIKSYFLSKYQMNQSTAGGKYDYFVFIFKK